MMLISPEMASATTKKALAQVAEEMDGEDGFAGNESVSNGTSTLGDKQPIEIANKETKQVFYTRLLVLCVLVCVAMAVSVLVFIASRNAEQEAFEDHFAEAASKVASEFSNGAGRRIAAIESLATQIMSHAISTNSTWPNVVLPHFERRGAYTRTLSDVPSVIFFPIVTNETLEAWESFSVAHQDWVAEGLATQGIPPTEWDQDNIAIVESTWGTTPGLSIPTEIFNIEGTSKSSEIGDGPYAPVSFTCFIVVIGNQSHFFYFQVVAICPSHPNSLPGKL